MSRSKYVYTPQQYKDHIESALSTKKSRCTVEDLFAIPDYKKLLDAHTDRRLNAQIKGEKTSQKIEAEWKKVQKQWKRIGLRHESFHLPDSDLFSQYPTLVELRRLTLLSIFL